MIADAVDVTVITTIKINYF